MTERETMEWIAGRSEKGSVYGLENIRALLQRLGNPQNKLQFVHIAGTNGKGSVLAFISTVLKCAGYRVGRYISPAVFSYRERIQVQERPIAKQALARLMTKVREAAEELEQEWETKAAGRTAEPEAGDRSEGADIHKRFITAFEIETALAFLYFVEKDCDIVVLEAGLGGALDATNVIGHTLAAVFTSISMDHMAVLGDSISQIAAQKAGIIKKGCRVVSVRQKPEAEQELRRQAAQAGADFVLADMEKVTGIRYGIKRQYFSYGGYSRLEITLAGVWQIENAVLAVQVIEELGSLGFTVTEKQLREGLCLARWDGRFTLIGEKPYFVVDGAHNEDAAKKLADSLRFYFTNKRIIYIMGILRDKEYEKIIRSTAELAEQIITVTPPGTPRAMHAYELAQEVRRCHPSVTAVDSLAEAVEMSRLLADEGSVIVAFGSLSYLGKLMEEAGTKDRGGLHGRSGKNKGGSAAFAGRNR